MEETTAKPPRHRWTAAHRLKLSREFARVRQEGGSVRGRFLTLGVLAVEGEPRFRVGLVTSRRIGGAVERNRVRRQLREIVRQQQHALVDGVWLVLVARPGAAQAGAAALHDEWLRLAQRASILRP